MPSIDPIPAFTDNYIWVIRNSQHAAAVDPGDAAPLLVYLESQHLDLVAILNTHHHADHVDGNLELKERFSCNIYGPAAESIPGLTHPVREGGKVVLPGLGMIFEVLDIPGHTHGHVAYYGNDTLFCGDTLFGCGCGRVFEGTMEQMYSSLEKLSSLPENTRVYCAHEYTLANIRFAKAVEPYNEAILNREMESLQLRKSGLPTLPSTIGLEKGTNPFLRCGVPEVAQCAQRHAGRQLDGDASVFEVLRIWKNGFK